MPPERSKRRFLVAGCNLLTNHRRIEPPQTQSRLRRHPRISPKDFSVDPRNSRRILLGAADAGRGDQSGGLYLTDDGGQTWQRIGREGPQTFGGYFHPKHDGWIYMTLTEDAPGAGLWLSRDNGKTWQAFDQLPFSNIQRVEFDPANDAMIHVTSFGGSVWCGPATPSEP